MYNVTGATGTGQYAGIWGGVTSGGSALASSWKFRGGLGGMDETAVVGLVKNWTTFVGGTWSDTQTTKSWPAFWRGSFKSPLASGVFATVGLRTSGLSSGSAWVNGHNIGRFSGNTLLYVPECWLTGDNTVAIYDASGNAPTSVKLEYFETRARYASTTGGTGGASGSGGTGGASGTGGTGGRTGSTGAGGATSGGGTNIGGTRGSGGVTGLGGFATGGAAGGTGTGGSGTAGSAGAGGAPVAGGGAGGAMGGRSGTSQGGASGGGGSSGGAGGSASTPNHPGSSSSGCACAVGGHGSGLAVWLAAAAVLLRRRRKARRTGGPTV
jgi:MYXO-CTERM domain-containing protein